jgi:diguanylate cyclase (GGDEF)-like protein
VQRQQMTPGSPRLVRPDHSRNGRHAVIRPGCAGARYLTGDCFRILETSSGTNFSDILLLAKQVCGTATSAISFATGDCQWVGKQPGATETDRRWNDIFWAHTIKAPGVFVVPDAMRDLCFADAPSVADQHLSRFYAGAPITDRHGTPVATLCVLDPTPRPHGISDIERETLRVLAMQVRTQFELRQSQRLHAAEVAQQKRFAFRMSQAIHRDPLTRLPNRLLFQKHCIRTIDAASTSGKRIAVMLIDVDHFKQVNDSIGHDAGDSLLRSFASRIRQHIRTTDMVARLGGDEFGVIFNDVGDDDQLSALLASLNARLREPLVHHGTRVECRASIGVARYPEHADRIDGLLKCCDLALSAAKVARDRGVIFTRELATDFEDQIGLLATAREMLNKNGVVPHYQPKIDLRTGAIVGFEALLRWRTAHTETAMPDVLAAAFSDQELAVSISDCMLTQIVADMAGWIEQGVGFGRIAINSCAADFKSNDFAERLLARLSDHDVPPSAIEVEVTEDVFLGRGSHHVERALTVLNERGVRIALDDFGTGYASLTHLKRFPVHTLKIDRSFVSGIGKNLDDTAIVRALVALGATLGLETVAEGIETEDQALALCGLGCDIGQGFLYGAARPARDVPCVISKPQAAWRPKNAAVADH